MLCAVLMAATYISVAEEEGAEPIELPTEEDGTGSHQQQQQLGCDITPACCCLPTSAQPRLQMSK